MSELQEVDVYVKPDGTVRVEVRGAKGGACLDITKDLEELLGGIVSERIYTDEFNQEADAETVEPTVEQKT